MLTQWSGVLIKGSIQTSGKKISHLLWNPKVHKQLQYVQ